MLSHSIPCTPSNFRIVKAGISTPCFVLLQSENKNNLQIFESITIAFLLRILQIVNIIRISFSETKSINDENCLIINPDIQKQIDSVVEQITKNIISISANYDDIDLRLLEISIDRHFTEESEKNTIVQVTINDCTKGQNKVNADNKNKNITSPIEKDEESAQVILQKENEAIIKSDDLNDDNNKLNVSKSEEIITNNKSDEPSDQLSDVDDKMNNNKEISKSKKGDEALIVDVDVNSNINKDNIPDVLEFINYNDIRKEFFNYQTYIDSEESLVLNDNDKIFFEALTKNRGTGPFVVYQRRYNNSEQCWFF